MRITFLSPHLDISGGVKVILTSAHLLQQRGHDVTVIAAVGGRKQALKQNLLHRFKNTIDWFDLSARLVCVPDFRCQYWKWLPEFPNADAIVATAWQTAPLVNSLPVSKGRKFYLIQHYEVWGGPKEEVDATWKMPLTKIVVSSWLKHIGEECFEEKVLGPLVYGVDFKQFYNDKKVYHQPRRVGMLYHTYDWKGVADGITAFGLAKEKHPDIQLVMIGARPVRENWEIDYEYYLNPPQDQLRHIYSSLDVWVCPSWAEGGPMPPMEAMACQCAVVTTDVGAVRDYGIPGETLLVSPPRDPESLAANLIRVLDDETLLKQLSTAGYDRIREFTWDRFVAQLEEYLSGIVL